jgi:hypothetical protein
MTHSKKLAIPMLIGIFLLTLTTINLPARIIHNSSSTAFEGDTESTNPETRSITSGNTSIEKIVIIAAGEYLNAYSNALILLNKIEMSDLMGVDFEEMQKIAETAVNSIQRTHYAYALLVEKAAVAQYNKTTLDKLFYFNYENFKKSHRLNTDIFNQVSTYLKSGDIRGAYDKIQLDTEELSLMLSNIKDSIDRYTIPENYQLWRMNEKFSDSMLFGQYVAEVFQSI